MILTDEELLLRLDSIEDNFVERKSSGDSRDWLKTAVAFANSVPVGYPAVLFIGVKDDGSIEETVNLDSLQKTLNSKLADAYPPIYYTPKIVERAGRQCLAVIIPGSQERPHFAGQSYVRVGSQTRKASEGEFSKLIVERNSKAYEILKWKDKTITVDILNIEQVRAYGRVASSQERTIIDCNQFYVTLQFRDSSVESIPLRRIELSFDHNASRLKLEVYPV